MPDKFEELMARHDGESPVQDASQAGDSRLDDPESLEMLEKLAAADKAFASAADDLLDLPVPDKLIEAIRNPQPQEAVPGNEAGSPVEPTPESNPEPEQKTAEVIPFPRRRGFIGMAIAAGVAAVIVTNTQLFQSPADTVGDSGVQSYAAMLQEVLESVPSGDVRSSNDGSISITPMVSFITDTASYCREFMSLQDGAQVSGVACRDDAGSWETVQQESVLSAPEDEAYRVAEGLDNSSELPAGVTRFAELSYAEEEAAIRSGWK